MIACRRLGLTKEAAEMLTKALQRTKYLLRTGHGTAAQAYQSTPSNRILGVGQGSGSAPSIWNAILDTILWSVSDKHNSFVLETPIKKIIKRLGDAFVDDTS